jgi:hypothetical protein
LLQGAVAQLKYLSLDLRKAAMYPASPQANGIGMPVDHRAMIEHRLEKSRRIIERQRELIARRRAAGHPTMHSENVLATFERTHAAFERSLRWIVKEQEMSEWPY